MNGYKFNVFVIMDKGHSEYPHFRIIVRNQLYKSLLIFSLQNFQLLFMKTIIDLGSFLKSHALPKYTRYMFHAYNEKNKRDKLEVLIF